MSLLTEGVSIAAMTGAPSRDTRRHAEHLSDLEGLFQDRAAWQESDASLGNPLVYEVIEYRTEGSDVFFGTTILSPGCVGTAFPVTRGHLHEIPAMGEICRTRRGEDLPMSEGQRGWGWHDGGVQHSTTFTASPPVEVSL